MAHCDMQGSAYDQNGIPSAKTSTTSCSFEVVLGDNVKMWKHLKAVLGITSDNALLLRLMKYFSESQGIRLPPTPVESVNENFIIIHQTRSDGGDFRLDVKTTERCRPTDRGTAVTVWLSDDECEPDPESQPHGSTNDADLEPVDAHRADVDFTYRKAARRRDRKQAAISPVLAAAQARKLSLCRTRRTAASRLLHGVLWRELVFRRRPSDVRVMFADDCVEGVRPPGWYCPVPADGSPDEATLLAHVRCAMCNQVGFRSRVDVAQHLWMQHPGVRERKPAQLISSKIFFGHAHCALCFFVAPFIPKSHLELTQHVDSEHVLCQAAAEEAPHACEVCLTEFATSAQHDDHLASVHAHHVPHVYSCCMCLGRLKGVQQYIRHLQVHYAEYKYACSMCPNFRTRDPDTMLEHTESHDRRYLVCDMCPLRSRTLRTIMDHVRTHLNMPMHVCTTCGYRAYTSSRYHNHLDSHGGRRHRCNLCGQEFSSLRKKSAHKIVAHRRPARFTCSRCGRLFTSTWRLQRHLFLHTGFKPFVCAGCGKRLSTRQSLRSHDRICGGRA